MVALLLDTHPQPKRSFANWYIKDFLTSLIIKRTEKLTNALPNKEDADMEGSSQQAEGAKMKEVSFSESDQLIEDLQKLIFA